MNQEISKSVFKAHALEVMRGIEQTGEDVVITAHGKRSLVIKQYKNNDISPLEKLKNTVVRFDEPTSPIDEDYWELG